MISAKNGSHGFVTILSLVLTVDSVHGFRRVILSNMSHVIRQLEERHVSVEIKLLRWNDRMDLLALANVKGAVKFPNLEKY